MTAISNPYDPLQPARDPAQFFGRGEVLAFFRQQLAATPHERALVLIGRRGLGKSSILQQLRTQLDDRYRLCVVPIGALDLTSEEALIIDLADAIRDALDEGGVSTYRLPDWPPPPDESDPDAPPPDARVWFRDTFLELALSALRIRFLLLALDDAHLLLEAVERGTLPRSWLNYLGDLLETFERLDLLLALDAAYEDRMLGIELSSDPGLHLRLADLPPEDAERLVREPVAGTLDYEDGVVEGILALAGGNPFLLHSVCRLLFRRSEERGHNGPITLHDLDAVQAAALDQADEIFGPLWANTLPNGRTALAALVRLTRESPDGTVTFDLLYGWLTGAGYAMNKTQLAAALRGLGYDGLIRAEADTYSLSAQLIALWATANAPLPEIEAPEPSRTGPSRLVPIVAVVVVLLAVGAIGAAALGGLFSSDDDKTTTPQGGAATATLALNLEATRQSDFATQTEQARPTRTPTSTASPTASATPSVTATATLTPSATPSLTPSATPSEAPSATPSEAPSATRTPRPSQTPQSTATRTPRPTQTEPPTATASPAPTDTPNSPATNTPRPTLTATLSPG